MNTPKTGVSVIIATHNRAALLAEAIQSVLAQQTADVADELEIIVVDDGSVDRTAEVVRAFGPPVNYVYQENAGPAAARNRGLTLSTGAVVGFLDDDDLWAPDALSRLLPVLFAEPKLDIVLGYTQRMITRETENGVAEFVDYRDPVRLYSLGCAIFRRRVFDRVGLLDETMRRAEDDDWFMRARSMNIAMLFLSEVTLYYRFHNRNMTRDRTENMPYLLRLVKKRLDRIRSGQEKP